MKKISLLMVCAAAILIAGCTKGPKYQVFNGTNFTLYDVIVFEYLGDDIIGQSNIGNLSTNSTSILINSESKAEKIKVSMRLLNEGERYYTKQFFYLNSGKKNLIEINNSTMVSNYLDKSPIDNGYTIQQVIF